MCISGEILLTSCLGMLAFLSTFILLAKRGVAILKNVYQARRR